MHLHDVLRKPLITEKSTRQQELANQYFFEVDGKANKNQIRAAVEKFFKVTVVGVQTVAARGSLKRAGDRMQSTKDWKKAIVTLKEGDKIEFLQSPK